MNRGKTGQTQTLDTVCDSVFQSAEPLYGTFSMWIVKNTLRGTLYVEDLDLKVPARGHVDLDALGRDRAEDSRHLQLAFDEGYLIAIRKTDEPGELDPDAFSTDEMTLQQDIRELKSAILDELNRRERLQIESVPAASAGSGGESLEQFRDALLTDLKALMGSSPPPASAPKADGISQTEWEARLALLEEKENELRARKTRVGKTEESKESLVEDLSDLLGDELGKD